MPLHRQRLSWSLGYMPWIRKMIERERIHRREKRKINNSRFREKTRFACAFDSKYIYEYIINNICKSELINNHENGKCEKNITKETEKFFRYKILIFWDVWEKCLLRKEVLKNRIISCWKCMQVLQYSHASALIPSTSRHRNGPRTHLLENIWRHFLDPPHVYHFPIKTTNSTIEREREKEVFSSKERGI